VFTVYDGNYLNWYYGPTSTSHGSPGLHQWRQRRPHAFQQQGRRTRGLRDGRHRHSTHGYDRCD
jgi:hypothetical protein